MSDDAEAVIFKVSEAIGAALDKFHFSMEALGDGVGLTEAPHGGDGFGPRGEGSGEGFELFKADGFEVLDVAQQLSGVEKALASFLCLGVEPVPKNGRHLALKMLGEKR